MHEGGFGITLDAHAIIAHRSANSAHVAVSLSSLAAVASLTAVKLEFLEGLRP
jgi:hypothetical protein